MNRKGIPLKEATRDCLQGSFESFPAESQQDTPSYLVGGVTHPSEGYQGGSNWG